MDKKQLNSNVVSAALLHSGFALVRLISASHAIELLGKRNLSHAKESESALLELITQLMEMSMHLAAVFAEMELMNQSNQTTTRFKIHSECLEWNLLKISDHL
jgi:hypothetical protein